MTHWQCACLRYSAAAEFLFAAAPLAWAQSVDSSKWSPGYVRSIAGTEEVDTAQECAKVAPLDIQGTVTF